ncbi:hypothetical protein GCM10007167_16990 [Vulcaniibacterium thermophilum]|jgi:type IV secretion system protein VirB1|uniref:Transglycosylase SLT domain-containing protein n=2 Tax=Vulcaniibacterium thermophilum TaxID=1169913 RepID=A0A918Z3G3_9GAMM|nr:hypothetical protein GCM10007167_16990 [Vulcaniibacterium thermophilum]
MLPGMELMACPDLAVPREVMQHVVRVESSFNPYAIGVVGGHLVRQPRNLNEALATVRMLEQKGYNFSLGLAQVNRYNLDKYGLDSYTRAFEPCPNLQAGSRILAECYGRSKGDWGKAFSCYYSGNFVTGFRHGYVQKIYASMRERSGLPVDAQHEPIRVVGRVDRRVVPVSRYPLARPPSRLEAVTRVEPSVPDAGQTSPRRDMTAAPASAPPVAPVGVAMPTTLVAAGQAVSTSASAPSTPRAASEAAATDEAFVF